jgi:hypothetical protein
MGLPVGRWVRLFARVKVVAGEWTGARQGVDQPKRRSNRLGSRTGDTKRPACVMCTAHALIVSISPKGDENQTRSAGEHKCRVTSIPAWLEGDSSGAVLFRRQGAIERILHLETRTRLQTPSQRPDEQESKNKTTQTALPG